MRAYPVRFVAILVVGIVLAVGACRRVPSAGSGAAGVRAELERRYAENTAAFQRWDLPAIMALRAPGFHSITPDGRTNDRAAMETYIEGLLHGIKKWNELTFTLDSLEVVGDTAAVIVHQYVDRQALRPDNNVHHVQTWVTQRETWVRSEGRWLLWRVDRLRDQRRMVDGVAE